MARQLLMEGLKGAFPFLPDPDNAKIIQESLPSGEIRTRVPGRFSICDETNGNNRRYRKSVWEKNLQSGSILTESIKRNGAFGLLEHPDDGVVTLRSPISHRVTAATLQEGKDKDGKLIWEVRGEISIYTDIPEGKKLLEFIKGGYNPLVSSRGFGSLLKANDGVDEVQDDYICEGWDVVIKPSFLNAELTPERNALDVVLAKTEEAKKVTEDLKTESVQPQASSGAAAVAATSVPTQRTINETTMQINEIKMRIAQLKATKVDDSVKFAEGMSQVQELHQAVSNYVAEDGPKRLYEGSKLDKSLDEIETTWKIAQQVPVKALGTMKESQTKLLKVIKVVTETALKFKQVLSETLGREVRQTKLIEELTKNGTGWMTLAETRKAKLDSTTRKYTTACEAIDIIKNRYHEDITELGRRLIIVEFVEQAKRPEIAKLLKEAKKPKDIVAIREQLVGKTEEKPTANATDAKTAVQTEVKADEAKTESVKESALAAAAPIATKTIEVGTPVSPKDLNESLGIVKRLSLATA